MADKNFKVGFIFGAKKAGSFNKVLGDLKVGFSDIGKFAAVGVGAALTGVTALMGVATKSAADMQAQISNVGTLLDGTAQQVKTRMGEMSSEIIDMSNRTGVATDDLNEGLYQTVSAFGDSADSMGKLEIAAKGAVAGNTSTTASLNLLAAVTKGYNDASLEATQKASDLAFQTVKLGQTSYEELASSMGQVIPIAKAMGGTQEDLFGAYATLTGVTGSTAEVTTQLRGVYQGFLQPTKQMTASIQKLGYADGQVMMDTLGLQGTLDALKGTVGGNELAFANLFGSVEAKSAVLAMTGAQAENLTAKTEAMYSSTGMANQAFETQTDHLNALVGRIKNYGKNALTVTGNAILPYAQELAEEAMPMIERAIERLPAIIDVVAGTIGDVMGKFGEIKTKVAPVITDIFGKTKVVVGEFAAVAGPIIAGFASTAGKVAADIYENWDSIAPILAGVVSGFAAFKTITKVISIVDNVKKAFGKTGAIVKTATKAFGFFTSPVGLAVIVIGALVAIGVLLYKNWDKIKAKASEIWGGVQQIFQNVSQGFQDFVAGFQERFPFLSELIGNAITGIQEVFEGLKSIFSGVITFITGVFTGDWQKAWEGVKEIFGGIFSTLGALLKIPINAVIGIINKAISGINSISVDVPDGVPVLGGKTFGFAIPEIPLLAKGGIVTGPTLAMVGEGSESEAVLPLSKLQGLITNQLDTGPIAAMLRQFVSEKKQGGREGGQFVFAPHLVLESAANETQIRRILNDEYEKFKQFIMRWQHERDRKGLSAY